jgi:orotate phosphoribosyltransferase
MRSKRLATNRLDSTSLSEEHEALKEILIERAIVYSRVGRQLYDRCGAPVPWLYYGGEVNLSWRGMDLTTRILMQRLSSFSSTQIATYGMSAISLLAACVVSGQGHYSGLVIRKEQKPYGVRRKIDGPIDRARSVVVIDESLSSGTTAYEAICALEAEGLKVEGVLCVVEFSGYGAAQWLRGRGYRVETVFDVWKDLNCAGAPVQALPHPDGVMWSTERTPSGLTPADASRYVAQRLAQTSLSPLPPLRFDRDYDARGGTSVSLRRRADDVRLVRAGFRRDQPDGSDAPMDLVLATNEAFRQAPPGTSHQLELVKFSVSFLGPLEPIRAGEIDQEQHALVVRGLGPPNRIGFALPNAPHYDDDSEQYYYARTVSARFWHHEPHALYRQRVQRVVESGADWPGYGAPRVRAAWIEDPDFEQALAARLRDILQRAVGEIATAEAVALVRPEEPIHGVGISIYLDGLVGCAVSWLGDLDAALGEATLAALGGERCDPDLRHTSFDRVTVIVSLLMRKRSLGQLSAERLPLFYRLGRDTLQASGNGRSAAVLAHFAVQQSLGTKAYQDQVVEQAGLRNSSPQWHAYETSSWIVTPRQCQRLERGFPIRSSAPDSEGDARWSELANMVATFIVGQRTSDGLPAYLFDPWTGLAVLPGTATRVLLALTGVLEAQGFIADGLVGQAEAILQLFVAGGDVARPRPGLIWDSGADAQLLNCLCQLAQRDRHRDLASRLVTRLRRLVRDDGAIHSGGARMPADLDRLSGSVLLALARASGWLGHVLDDLDLATSFEFYRRRFRLSHPWGMVWWHAQAWSALADRRPDFREFAFELVDWAIERQSGTSGAFIVDSMEPQRASFLTACVLEGVAAAWGCAHNTGDLARAERYECAWRGGAAFLGRLVIHEGDSFFSPYQSAAIGGVRPTLVSSLLHIDYAGHAMLALAKGLRAAALKGTVSAGMG